MLNKPENLIVKRLSWVA